MGLGFVSLALRFFGLEAQTPECYILIVDLIPTLRHEIKNAHSTKRSSSRTLSLLVCRRSILRMENNVSLGVTLCPTGPLINCTSSKNVPSGIVRFAMTQPCVCVSCTPCAHSCYGSRRVNKCCLRRATLAWLSGPHTMHGLEGPYGRGTVRG